jgi:hypothetical protein
MPQIYRDNHATLSTLLDEASSDKGATLLIPDLQRPYKWTPRQVIVLVDSLLRGWPFGSLLLWSVSQDQVAQMPFRAFARTIDRVDEATDRMLPRQQPATFRMVLDGQQRVQSLLLAFGGDSWGFKLLDKEWHEVLKERRPRGRTSRHWSLGEVCLDLAGLKVEIDSKKKIASVDFTTGPLVWAVRSTSKNRSSQKRPPTYEDPLLAADDKTNVGRFVRLSRFWELAGNRELRDYSDFEEAIEKLLIEHQTPEDLAKPLHRPLTDLLPKLREVRDTRVTFLEVEKFDAGVGTEAVYMDAVVNIFTRLNTAGRTLTEEEITFAWVKSGWKPDKVDNRSANECFETLREKLKDVGVELKLDNLMAGIAFVWSVVFNDGKVLSQRDLLNANAIRPMAHQLAEEWNTLEKSIRAASEVIQQRGLEFGRHYLSLNALAVLWAWRYLADRWAGAKALREVARDGWDKELAGKFGPLSDRWLVCSQWAGYWGASSVPRVSDLASKLTTLKTTTDALTERADASKVFVDALKGIVGDTQSEATNYIDRLSVDDRNQVRQYFTPLWIWHRLGEARWAMSAVPLRHGKKQPTLDVDHVVAVKLWEKLPAGAATGEAASEEEPLSATNELGNCLLLETAFNISKSATPLGEWLKNVHEFKTGPLKQAEWSAELGLSALLLDPTGSTVADVVAAVMARTASIKQDLKDYVGGAKARADL